MRAVVIDDYGNAGQLHEADVPMPTPGPHQLLIEVHAASVNAVDAKIRAGQMATKLSFEFPLVLGLDFAGTVSQVGAEVSDFAVGDAVLAKANLADNGCYAEFVVIDANLVVPKPPNLSFEEAAALPLAGMTGWQALNDFAQLRAGETVLIQGGSGGIGTLSIQFAKALGAHVITTVSASNAAMARKLGADRVISYDQEDFVSILGPTMDVVFDMIGGDVLTRSYDVLREGGRLVAIWGQPDPELDAARGVTSSTFVTLEGGQHLAQIVRLAHAGQVRPVIGSVFPFTTAGLRAAHTLAETGHPRGKSIIAMK